MLALLLAAWKAASRGELWAVAKALRLAATKDSSKAETMADLLAKTKAAKWADSTATWVDPWADSLAHYSVDCWAVAKVALLVEMMAVKMACSQVGSRVEKTVAKKANLKVGLLVEDSVET